MSEKFSWRLCALAACALALLALVPQAQLWLARGRDWQGQYAYFYTDEPAYAAYLNALIEGRPRRNDPYTGRDDRTDAPLPESLFSIQPAPAYLLAAPARLFRLSASTVFILLMPLVAALSGVAVYWLLWMLTRDAGASFAGVFVTLCLGILVSGQGWLNSVFGLPTGYVFLPFLRRYVPGVPLVFLFLFCGLAWLALTSERRRARLLASVGAGLTFALLVFSYFYHWTTAAALLACLAIAWAAARPDDWRDRLKSLAVIAALALASLAPYFALVSRRAATMDAAQALLHTRSPDLWRGVILLAALTLAALAWGALRKLVRPRDPAALFAAALAATVLAVFNQQILTGRSLQPMHYEQYVGNYLALLAASIAATLIMRGRARTKSNAGIGAPVGDARTPRLLPRRVWASAALAAFLWGACEVCKTTYDYARQQLYVDDWAAVTRRLDELAREETRRAVPSHDESPPNKSQPDESQPNVSRPVESQANASRPYESAESYPVVFSPSDLRLDLVPGSSSCAVVWAPHTFSFSTLAPEEQKRRLFLFLHLAGVAPRDFAAQGRDQGFLQFNLFGWERANPRLTARYQPVTPAEIEAERRNYAAFVADVERASAPPAPLLSFLVLSDDQPFDTTNLERLYERGAGVRVGRHTIHGLRPRAR